MLGWQGGGTVKNELPVSAPGSYILRWDNTHSRMRAKQVTYKCSVRTEPARAAAASVLGDFGGAEPEPAVEKRPMTPRAPSAEVEKELAQCKEALAQEQATTASLRTELEAVKTKLATAEAAGAASAARVAELEATQAKAKVEAEKAADDFDVPDFDDIPNFDD